MEAGPERAEQPIETAGMTEDILAKVSNYLHLLNLHFEEWRHVTYSLMIVNVHSSLRPLSLYCLVDEVLRHGKIMPDENKNLTFCFYFIFSSDMTKKKQGFFFRKLCKSSWNLLIFTCKSNFPLFFYFFLRPEATGKVLFLFFFLRQGTKDPCRSSSTKQYSEFGLKYNHCTLRF